MRSSRFKGFAALSVLSVVLAVPAGVHAGKAVQNGSVHGGTEVGCDLPMGLRVRNTVGTDGLGLCVWASTEMAARYQNCRQMIGVFEAMQKEPGGGWPERVDAVMKKMAPGVKYRQYLGKDIAFIRDALDSGRPCCVTYGYGEFYGNKTIAHMVLCVYMDDSVTAILDNNDPEHLWWMATGEFARRFTWREGGQPQGWAWYMMAPPPPPPPHN